MLLFNFGSGDFIDNDDTYFNTSNVTIQHHRQVYVMPQNTISIHLMLLFNRQRLLMNSLQWLYFNTSNVTIQLKNSLHISFLCSYFNTSNVTIQRNIFHERYFFIIISIHLMLLFNSPVLHLRY